MSDVQSCLPLQKTFEHEGMATSLVPSWSWASCYESISYHHVWDTKLSRAFSLQEDIKSDHFGNLLNGPLRVRGQIQIVLVPRTEHQKSEKLRADCYRTNA
jgi:hypothetical protein